MDLQLQEDQSMWVTITLQTQVLKAHIQVSVTECDWLFKWHHILWYSTP